VNIIAPKSPFSKGGLFKPPFEKGGVGGIFHLPGVPGTGHECFGTETGKPSAAWWLVISNNKAPGSQASGHCWEAPEHCKHSYPKPEGYYSYIQEAVRYRPAEVAVDSNPAAADSRVAD